jgi:hypothetical protein
VRRLVLAAGKAAVFGVSVTSCGTAVHAARDPEPTASATPRVHLAAVGEVVTLTGTDPASGTAGLRMAVEVKQVVSTTAGRGAFEEPRKGERFAAVRFVFKNLGETEYLDSPTFGAKLIVGSGQGYDPTVATVTAGPGFPGVVSLLHDQVRSGFIVFAIPRRARIAGVQYALNAGDAPERAEWRVAMAGSRS